MTFSLIGSLVDVLTGILRTVGLPGLFALMIVESFGIPPLPSEVILPFAGFLVAEGVYGFVPAVVVAVAGGLVGAFIAYAVGRWWRHRIEGMGFGYLRLSPRRLARMDAYFARRGEITVAVARLLPILRSYISYPAGTARMSPTRFGIFTAVGATPFAVGLIYAGVVLRSNWGLVEQEFGLLDDVLIALVVLIVVFLGLVALGWIRPKFLAEPETEGEAAASVAAPPKTL
jgi:membrane protein DedA with SNARE-associated domain